MKISNTALRKLELHLSKFSPLLIENVTNNNIRLSRFEFIDVSHEIFFPNCLYIVNLTNVNHSAILKKEANFLILTNHKQQIVGHLGEKTNALIIPDSVNPLILTNYVQGFFHASENFHEFTYQILQELEHENNLKNYLNILAGFISHPVALLDASLHVISHSDLEEVADPVWTFHATSEGLAVTKDLHQYLANDLPDLLPRLEYPMFYENATIPRRILCRIKTQNNTNYLLEILEDRKAFDVSDLAFAFSVSSFLQYFMSTKYHSFRQDSIDTLIEDIISEKEKDTFRMYNRAEALQLMLDSENYMLLVYTDTNIGFRQLLQSVHDLRQLTKSTTVLLGSEILIILSGKGYQETVNKKILPYIKSQKCFKCSFSARFNGISALKNAYIQCCAAKELGAIMDINGTWFDYEAYREMHFANYRLSDEDVDFFCTPVAKEIVQHDRMHKTRYAYTLMLYIKNFKNAATVARIMNTHRNTMFYRLEKMAEQFGLNYDNPIQMNNLSLSFNILASRYPDIFT